MTTSDAGAARSSPLEIQASRVAFREAAGVQIVRDSVLDRGLAVAFVLTWGGRSVGHAGVWTAHYPGRVMEFYVAPEWREAEIPLLRALVRASGATGMEAQTNLPAMARVLSATVPEPGTEKLLFQEARETVLAPAGATFRSRRYGDGGPEGPWVVERAGRVVAGGGLLHHYNPPWDDLYMEVEEDARRQGIGSFLVQELRRVSARSGRRAAARCDPDNEGSRRALVRGGMELCGRILYGTFGDLTGPSG